MNPLLQGFLAGPGEAIIRGVLSRFKGQAIQNGRLTVLAQGFVTESLNRKGFDTAGMGERDLRSVIQSAARAQEASRRMETDGDKPITAAQVPAYPGSVNNGVITSTVVVSVQYPDGTTGDVVVQVTNEGEQRANLTFAQAIEDMRHDRNILSDPRGSGSPAAQVVGYRIVSTYTGQP